MIIVKESDRGAGPKLAMMRRKQFESNCDQECKQHIDRRQHSFRNIIEQDTMQPTLNEITTGCCATQRIFQRRKRTYHTNERLPDTNRIAARCASRNRKFRTKSQPIHAPIQISGKLPTTNSTNRKWIISMMSANSMTISRWSRNYRMCV